MPTDNQNLPEIASGKDRKLKPCPFCGGEATYGGFPIRDGRATSCRSCGAQVHAYNGPSGNTQDVVNKIWNTRAAVSAWCFDMDAAPKNERLLVFLQSDDFGHAGKAEIRTLRKGNWVGQHDGYHWANDHNGIRTRNPVYSAWMRIEPPK